MSSKEEDRLRREVDELRDQLDNETRKSTKLEKTKTRLEKNIEELEKQNNEILELRKSNRKLEADVLDFKKKLGRTLEESTSLREEQLKNLRQVEQETEDLRQKLRDVEKGNRDLEKEKIRLNTVNISLESDLDKQTKLASRYKQSSEDTTNDLNSAKTEIEQFKQNEIRLQEEAADLRNKERSAIDRITLLNTELAAKSTDHARMKEEIDKKLQPLKFELEERKEEVDRLNTKIKSLYEEIDHLKAQQEEGVVAQMTRELSQQKEEMERAQRKFERESQENRLIYDQKIHGVEGDLNTLRSNQDVMARMFSDEKLEYEKKYLTLQDEKKKVLTEYETLKKKMTQQEDTNRKLQQDNQKNQKEEIVIRDLKEQVRQLTYQLSATERFGNERSKSAADTMRQAADMATLQKKHDEETKRQKDDNVRLTGELSKLNEEVRKLNEDKQKRDKETSTLKTQYEGAQKRVDEVKKLNSQVLKDLNTKCKALENENRSLKKAAGLPISDSLLSLKSPSLDAALQEIDSSSRKDVIDDE